MEYAGAAPNHGTASPFVVVDRAAGPASHVFDRRRRDERNFLGGCGNTLWPYRGLTALHEEGKRPASRRMQDQRSIVRESRRHVP